MPIHRITLASNTNRNTKTVLLLSSDSTTTTTTTPDFIPFIFSAAKSKLRLKKPTKLYLLPTGVELSTHDEVLAAVTTAIYQPTLLVSMGEPYIGTVAAPAPKFSSAVHSLVNSAFLDPLSIRQLHTCAALPGMQRVVGQPDLHPGGKFPIGAVFVSKGFLHPPLIGGDIGCGMSWYRVSGLAASSIDTRTDVQRLAETVRGLEGVWGSQSDREAWLGGAEHAVGDPKFDAMLGTIGAGNHFAELQVIESVDPDVDGLAEDDVVLLVHSGSRGFGQDVLGRFYNPSAEKNPHPESIDIAAAPEWAAEYLAAHDKAVYWAQANRDLIALRFLQRLEPHNPDLTSDSAAAAATLRAIVQSRKFVDITHNAVIPMSNSWPGEPETVYIHRKGAAPCLPDMPLLPLPGSRGTPTLLLRPTFGEKNDNGLTNAFSAAHGAGRSMSRAKATATLKGKYDDANTRKTTVRADWGGGGCSGDDSAVAGGGGGGGGGGGSKKPKVSKGGDIGELAGWTICDEKELVWEEAPEAYKDVELVGKDLESAGVVEVVGRARPRLTYKCRFEQEWKEEGGGNKKKTSGKNWTRERGVIGAAGEEWSRVE